MRSVPDDTKDSPLYCSCAGNRSPVGQTRSDRKGALPRPKEPSQRLSAQRQDFAHGANQPWQSKGAALRPSTCGHVPQSRNRGSKRHRAGQPRLRNPRPSPIQNGLKTTARKLRRCAAAHGCIADRTVQSVRCSESRCGSSPAISARKDRQRCGYFLVTDAARIAHHCEMSTPSARARRSRIQRGMALPFSIFDMYVWAPASGGELTLA